MNGQRPQLASILRGAAHNFPEVLFSSVLPTLQGEPAPSRGNQHTKLGPLAPYHHLLDYGAYS
jgi:hypothetical protein